MRPCIQMITACLLLTLLAGCAKDYTIAVDNKTSIDLVPYPVVTTPPPPHREADPAGTIAAGGQGSIDPTGFNPYYYIESLEYGIQVQLSLDVDPAQILVRTLQHQVPPGQEGSDPALQPTQLSEELFEPTSKTLALIVQRTADGLPITLEER